VCRYEASVAVRSCGTDEEHAMSVELNEKGTPVTERKSK
jgi:hypothetical protein